MRGSTVYNYLAVATAPSTVAIITPRAHARARGYVIGRVRLYIYIYIYISLSP